MALALALALAMAMAMAMALALALAMAMAIALAMAMAIFNRYGGTAMDYISRVTLSHLIMEARKALWWGDLDYVAEVLGKIDREFHDNWKQEDLYSLETVQELEHEARMGRCD